MMRVSRQDFRQDGGALAGRPGETLVSVRVAAEPSALARAVTAANARRAPVDAAIAVALDITEAGFDELVDGGVPQLPRPERWVTPAGYERWFDVLDGRYGWWEDTLPVALVPSRLADAAGDRRTASAALALIADPRRIDAVFRIERWAVLCGGLRASEILARVSSATSTRSGELEHRHCAGRRGGRASEQSDQAIEVGHLAVPADDLGQGAA